MYKIVKKRKKNERIRLNNINSWVLVSESAIQLIIGNKIIIDKEKQEVHIVANRFNILIPVGIAIMDDRY